MMDKILHDACAAIIVFLLGLLPAALGAAVTLAYEDALPWRMKVVQFSVGVTVSYFAKLAFIAVCLAYWGTPPNQYVEQAVTFTLGMIGYRATPRFRDAVIEIVVGIPDALRNLVPFLRRKDPQ